MWRGYVVGEFEIVRVMMNAISWWILVGIWFCEQFSLQWRHTLCLNLGLLQKAPGVDIPAATLCFFRYLVFWKINSSFLPSQPSWTARIGKKVEDRIRCGVDDIRKREHCILTVAKSFFLSKLKTCIGSIEGFIMLFLLEWHQVGWLPRVGDFG